MKHFDRWLNVAVNTLEQLSIQAQRPNSCTSSYPAQQPSSAPTVPEQHEPMPYYPNASYSRLVYPSNGQLVYTPYNEWGDRILDFSGAGYNEGYTGLPSVPIVAYLDPTAPDNDETDRIQQAINNVSRRPLQADGFRGALQLNRGTWTISRALEIHASGVVLQGDPAGGTVLVAAHTMGRGAQFIRVAGEANVMAKKRLPIRNKSIPVAGRHVEVDASAAKHLRVGQAVVVAVNFNDAWIKAIGMDVIHPKGNLNKNNGWKPGKFEHLRRIVAIQNTTIVLNEPLTTRLAADYGGGHIEAYENKRVQRVGIQFLECICPANQNRGPDEIMQEEKGKVKDYRFAAELFDHLLISMDHAENCWVQQVRSVWWRNFIRLGTNTVAITLKRCQHTFPQHDIPQNKIKLPLAGQFAFEISGQLVLIEECHAEYSFHAYSYKGRVPGPNVVYQSTCIAKNGDVGPHMKWSSGQLYDSCNIEGQMIIQDRFDAGSGHGWSGANSVVWNTVAHAGMVVQNPPLAQNFLIGSSSKRGKIRMPEHEWAFTESPDQKVNPPSLYMAQKQIRMEKSCQTRIQQHEKRETILEVGLQLLRLIIIGYS